MYDLQLIYYCFRPHGLLNGSNITYTICLGELSLTVVYIVPVVWYNVAILSCTTVKRAVPFSETWTMNPIKVVYLETC